jgi:hypothetical protein
MAGKQPNSLDAVRRSIPVGYLLRDAKTSELFCQPHGDDFCEWNRDPSFAHRFASLDRAVAGARVFLEIHNRPLEVLTFADAVNEFDASELRSPDSWSWQEADS